MTPTIAPKRRKPEPPPHGEVRRYNYWKCRCDDCREAKRIHDKRQRERRATSAFVDATGTIRRVRGLVAIGYSYTDLGARLGTRPEFVAYLAYGNTGPRGILCRTADTIRDLCNVVRDEGPPTGRGAAYARTVGRRHGWAPLHAWDNIDDPAERPAVSGPVDDEYDEVLVKKAMAGGARWGQLYPADRLETVRRLRARNVGSGTIARLLDMSSSTIHDYLVKHAAELAESGVAA